MEEASQSSAPRAGVRRVLSPRVPIAVGVVLGAIVSLRVLLFSLYGAGTAALVTIAVALAVVISTRWLRTLIVDDTGLILHRVLRIRWEDMVHAEAKRISGFAYFVISLRKRLGLWRRVTLSPGPRTRAAILELAPAGHVLAAAVHRAPAARTKAPLVLGAICLVLLIIIAFQTEFVWALVTVKNGRVFAARARSYEKIAPQLEQDMARADTLELFRAPFGARDAGAWLNTRIGWHAPGGPSRPSPELPSALPDSCPKRWLDCIDRLAEMEIDLSWMAAMRQFDRWDLDATGPRADALRRGTVDPYELPEPDYRPILDAARIRLSRSTARGDLETGVLEARWLARLAYSTETWVGARVALAILEDERKLSDRLSATGRRPSFVWVTAAAADLEAAQRSLWGSQASFDLVAPAAKRTWLFAGVDHFGACTAMRASMPSLARARPLLEVPFPFEPDFSKEYAALDRLLLRSANSCRLVAERAYWRSDAARKWWMPKVMKGSVPNPAGAPIWHMMAAVLLPFDWLADGYPTCDEAR